MSTETKRRSFRVRESVQLDYEILSEREFREGAVRRSARLGHLRGLRSRLLDIDARLAERLYLLRASSAAVAECLTLMNEKIDAVIARLPEVRDQTAALASREPQVTELGADGMILGTERALAPGTHLALRLLLPPNNRYIETFATVLRDVPAPDPEDQRHPHGAAVEFSGLETAQREVIIQHLFNREAEALRARRLQETPEGDEFVSVET